MWHHFGIIANFHLHSQRIAYSAHKMAGNSEQLLFSNGELWVIAGVNQSEHEGKAQVDRN